jgi:hypothetical protein
MRSACLPAAMIVFWSFANNIAHGQENLETLKEKICRGMYSSAELCFNIGKADGFSTCVAIAHRTAQAMIDEAGDQLFLLTEETCLIGCATAQGSGSAPSAVSFSNAVPYDRFREIICPD